jgi:hypothetical protein
VEGQAREDAFAGGAEVGRFVGEEFGDGVLGADPFCVMDEGEALVAAGGAVNSLVVARAEGVDLGDDGVEGVGFDLLADEDVGVEFGEHLGDAFEAGGVAGVEPADVPTDEVEEAVGAAQVVRDLALEKAGEVVVGGHGGESRGDGAAHRRAPG